MVCKLLSKYKVSPSSLTCVTLGALSLHCRGSRAMVRLCPSALLERLQLFGSITSITTVTIVSVVIAQDQDLHLRSNFRVSLSYLTESHVKFHQHHHQHFQSGNLLPYVLFKRYLVYTFTFLFLSFFLYY